MCYILLEMDCIFHMYHAAAVSNSGCNGYCILGLHPFDERWRYFVILDNSILHYPCPVWSPHARQPRMTNPSHDCYIQILQLCDGLTPVTAIADETVGLFNERICSQTVQNRLWECHRCACRPRHGLHLNLSDDDSDSLGSGGSSAGRQHDKGMFSSVMSHVSSFTEQMGSIMCDVAYGISCKAWNSPVEYATRECKHDINESKVIMFNSIFKENIQGGGTSRVLCICRTRTTQVKKYQSVVQKAMNYHKNPNDSNSYHDENHDEV